jgi:hypothetical protein
MHKSLFTFGLLASSLVMLVLILFMNQQQQNSFLSNTALAQEYDNDNSYGDNSYSKYPTDDKKYECRTGPFEGFFVSSVEFCKHIKFDDKNRKDTRDNRTGTQGPPGPPGPASTIPGPQGPAGLSTINTTNIYTNVGLTASGNITGPAFSSIATCDAPNDTALSGSFFKSGSADIIRHRPLATENGWNVTAIATVNAGTGGPTGSVTADVVCFDNPPLRP